MRTPQALRLKLSTQNWKLRVRPPAARRRQWDPQSRIRVSAACQQNLACGGAILRPALWPNVVAWGV